MRILGIGDYLDLGDLYLRLLASGHEVRAYAADPAYQQVMSGMVPRAADWRRELPWIRAAGADGVIVFETAGQGRMQDGLRADGYHVIGGSALGDRLEGDRGFGQEILRRGGMRTAANWGFRDYPSAIAFIRAHPGRYVYKHNGHRLPSTHNYVGMMEDGEDLAALLACYERSAAGREVDFILMEHVSGIETGVGAYFNGEEFLAPACLDWEHKRFFTGDRGELTGEMGTLVTYRGGERLFAEVLAPLAPRLRAVGHRGYVNVNTIINQDGVWPLEFTCRFGYPGYAILDALQSDGWEGILRAMAHGGETTFATHDGYAVGVVLTIPPFPYADSEQASSRGLPICFHGGISADELRHLHYAEVALDDGRLVTSGGSGYVLVATGCGDTVAGAQRQAYDTIARVVVPNGRYRTDIGDRFRAGDGERLRRLGYTGYIDYDSPVGASTRR